MFLLLRPLFEFLAPLQVPFCLCAVWGLILLLGWNAWMTLHSGVQTLRQLHQIPCSGCQFLTGDYHLKCTVQPAAALTEVAIGCPDFRPGRSQVSPRERPVWSR